MPEKFTNRLAHEKSPYLLQHAHNPVDWYPWGEEAFSAAVRHNKPIFLSIGYATCHWCHVMEKNVFSNLEIAKKMNELFVCIKVDREERPDVDSLYMDFAQALMPGMPGWPLNVILTPELLPFYAATYLPPKAMDGMMGMEELMDQVERVWGGDQQDQIVQQGERIVTLFQENTYPVGDDLPHEDLLHDVAEAFFHEADPVWGGLHGSPKFPMGYHSVFLLHYYSRYRETRALYWVEKTLLMMQRGGIYDRLEGGFHRYTIDQMWEIPHFEKMLYDNALLADAYLEAWQLTKKDEYREVCEKTLRYMMTVLKDPSTGAFYSAQDADSEGVEGKYYTWTYDEVKEALGQDDCTLFCEYYGVVVKGNVDGRSVLRCAMSLDEYAEKRRLDPDETAWKFKGFEEKLLQIRKKRERPIIDDKVITSWNGLAINVLAKAGAAFDDEIYIDGAVRAAGFLMENMWDKKQLLRRFRDGESAIRGCLDDYAYLIRGLLTLFEVSAEAKWLAFADQLHAILVEKFKAEDGAFYETDGEDRSIILRKCPFTDGAEPSGNAVHTENLIRLYQMTHAESFLREAEDIIRAVTPFLNTSPTAFAFHSTAFIRYFQKSAITIIVAFNEKKEYKKELERLIWTSCIPHKVVIFRYIDDHSLFSMIPYVEKMVPVEDRTTLYICENKVCLEPLTDYEKMVEAIERL